MRTLTISPTTCTDLGGKAYRLCLPVKEVCDPATSGLSEIGQGWNCNVCPPDQKYNIPYVQGDVIHIQTRYFDSYNANPKDPVSGFGAFIDAVLTDGDTRIPLTGMVAWGCNGSYQITVIETKLLSLKCWTVEYTVRNSDDSVRLTAQSEEYGEVSGTDCNKTVLIQGKGKGVDCFGYCYDEPTAFVGDNVAYNNATRYWGGVRDIGGTFDKPETTGGYFAAESFENYRLALGRKIPPFAKEALLKQLLSAPEVLIDGEAYDIDTFSVDNEVTKGRMFFFSVEFTRRCKAGGC